MSRSEQFFHGTSAEIPVGGEILPGNKVGVPSRGRTSAGYADADRAFATTDESYAWKMADLSSSKTGGRARVYEVAPHPEQEVGFYNRTHQSFNRSAIQNGQRVQKRDLSEYHAPSYTVTGRQDIKPGHQGTLALNWRQFADPATASVKNVNHPSLPSRKSLETPVPSPEEHPELPGQGRLW